MSHRHNRPEKSGRITNTVCIIYLLFVHLCEKSIYAISADRTRDLQIPNASIYLPGRIDRVELQSDALPTELRQLLAGGAGARVYEDEARAAPWFRGTDCLFLRRPSRRRRRGRPKDASVLQHLHLTSCGLCVLCVPRCLVPVLRSGSIAVIHRPRLLLPLLLLPPLRRGVFLRRRSGFRFPATRGDADARGQH